MRLAGLKTLNAKSLISTGAFWADTPKGEFTGFGREFGVPLKFAGLTEQIFVEGRQAYVGQAWSSQIVKLLEDVLHTDLRAPGFPAELE